MLRESLLKGVMAMPGCGLVLQVTPSGRGLVGCSCILMRSWYDDTPTIPLQLLKEIFRKSLMPLRKHSNSPLMCHCVTGMANKQDEFQFSFHLQYLLSIVDANYFDIN